MLPRLVFDDNNGNRNDDIDPAIRADLAAFDAAPDPLRADLSAFDRAEGRPVLLPAGRYVLRVELGELTMTRTSKLAYRLRFSVIEPSEYAGHSLNRWLLLDSPAACNRAKIALAPLGLTTSEALRKPFPAAGQVVHVNALVVIKPAANGYPESNSIERFTPCDRPAEATPGASTCPFAVPLDGAEEGGGA
jgi:hypothetical protein